VLVLWVASFFCNKFMSDAANCDVMCWFFGDAPENAARTVFSFAIPFFAACPVARPTRSWRPVLSQHPGTAGRGRPHSPFFWHCAGSGCQRRLRRCTGCGLSASRVCRMGSHAARIALAKFWYKTYVRGLTSG
jgi:hypothetical protein